MEPMDVIVRVETMLCMCGREGSLQLVFLKVEARVNHYNNDVV